MSTIATHSHWPLGPAILAGAVLSAICISPGSTQAQPDSPQVNTQNTVATLLIAIGINWGELPGMVVPFKGKPTASGEPFNMNSMTCAHRSLPLGATVLVTNLRNHRSVLVRVNDRGPVPENPRDRPLLCSRQNSGVPRRRIGAARPG